MARKHDSLREGAWLGVVVATSIWVWLAVVDAAVGERFRTFTVLGGLALFTILHYLFNVVYGVVIVSVVHGAAREPSLVIGMAFGFLVIEFGFVMVTVLLSHMGLGELAWARILGGNLIGAAIAFVMLSRRHRLRDGFRQAEGGENELGASSLVRRSGLRAGPQGNATASLRRRPSAALGGAPAQHRAVARQSP